MGNMGKYGHLPPAGILCPNCLKELADCVEDNDGWGKCKVKRSQNLSHLCCPRCFTQYDSNDKPRCNCKKENKI